MNSGAANDAAVNFNTSRQNRDSNNSGKSNSRSGFRSIMERSRLSEEDLEQFCAHIIETHKKKHHRVLKVSILLFICFGLIAFYFAS